VRVSVDPHSQDARLLAVSAATLGSMMVLIGGVLLATRVSESCDAVEYGSCSGGHEGIYIGIPLLLTGLPLAINGWVYFGSTYRLDVGVAPLSPSSTSRRSAAGHSGLSPPPAAISLRLAF